MISDGDDSLMATFKKCDFSSWLLESSWVSCPAFLANELGNCTTGVTQQKKHPRMTMCERF